MMTPVRISYRGMTQTDALEAAVHERIAWLEHHGARLTGCQVAIEAPHRHHQKGQHFRVRVDLTTPDGEVVAGRSPPEHVEHEDCYLAIREAFRAARRQLDDRARRRRDVTAASATER